MAKLYFYYSAMNAGKSTTLLQSAHNYEERGMRVLLLTPRIDDRAREGGEGMTQKIGENGGGGFEGPTPLRTAAGTVAAGTVAVGTVAVGTVGVIGSRIGLQREAYAFQEDDDLLLHVWREHQSGPLSCVLVDEAQFLSARQVLQLTLVCDRLRIPVLCYGLRTDFRGEPFEGSKYLLAWADELVEIKTICHTGKKATMNARLDEQGQRVVEGQQICIGHNYMSVSRSEFALDEVSPVGYSCTSELPRPAPGNHRG